MRYEHWEEMQALQGWLSVNQKKHIFSPLLFSSSIIFHVNFVNTHHRYLDIWLFRERKSETQTVMDRERMKDIYYKTVDIERKKFRDPDR